MPMKKRIIALCAAAVQTASIFSAMSVHAQDDELIKKFELIKTETLPKLEALIKECEDKKIFVDYEKSDYRVIEKFIDIGINDASIPHLSAVDRGVINAYAVGYGGEDMEVDKTDRAEYIYEEITELAVKTENSLVGYLNNTKEPIGNVVKYVASDVTADGYSFIAENENGDRVPVLFTGYGHFGQAAEDVKIFADMGVNVIQLELGMSMTMRHDGNGGMYFSTDDGYVQNMIKIFDEAEKYNVGISLLLSPHYIPGWFNEVYPGKGYGGYYSATDEMRTMLKLYVEGIMATFGTKPALQSICLTNEPTYRVGNEEYDLPLYKEFLKERYNNDIAALNSIHKTKYKSFDDVKWPDTDLIYEPESNKDNLAPVFDYIEFNDKFFADTHKYLYELVTASNPEILAGAKVMQDYDCDERDWRRAFILYGSNVENLGQFLTINGNDANNFYDPQDYQWDIMNKMSYYDLQGSIKAAPVFNFEDHIIRDRDAVYGKDITVSHVSADMWQGAIHGRGGTTIWVWDRSYDDDYDFSGSILNRPDVVSANSKAMLDLNRLAPEVTALQHTTRKIGILQSRTARLYSLYNSNSLTKSYEAATFAGERVDFVTENQAIAGKLNNSNIEVLIVPYSENLKAGTAEAVQAYIQAGGKVIVIGEESFTADQYNRPVNADVKNYIMANSTVIDERKVGVDQLDAGVLSDVWTTLTAQFGTGGVRLIDAATGAPAYGVSYSSAVEDGAVIVNICNYDYDNVKNVNVLYNGIPVTEAVELRSMTTVSGSNIALQPVEPILLRFENGLYSDTAAHWAMSSVKNLWAKDIVDSNSNYAPESAITAAEFAKLVNTAFEIKIDGGEEILTRQAMAKAVVEICKQKKLTLVSGALDGFVDAEQVTDMESMGYAVGMGIISGTDDGKLMPAEAATKAQAAAVISRLLEA